MHLDPFLANEGKPNRGPLLVIGSTLAIEPMLTLGTTETSVLATIDRRHRRRVAGGALGAHGCRDRGRAADFHHAAVGALFLRWSGHARLSPDLQTFALRRFSPGIKRFGCFGVGLKRFGCLGVGIGGSFVAAGHLDPEEGRASLRADRHEGSAT